MNPGIQTCQIEEDFETLSDIIAGLDRLEAEFDDARRTINARQRGYFTPDEDDRVQRMIVIYRGYRSALFEIIQRYRDYTNIVEPDCRLRGFAVGFAAALTLYARSLKVIENCEGNTLVRRKINEPDDRIGLRAGFFEELLESYSSLHNYHEIQCAQRFWRKHQRQMRGLRDNARVDLKVLRKIIRRERSAVRRRLLHILSYRLWHDWRTLWHTTIGPIQRTGYRIRSTVAGSMTELRLTRNYQPAVDEQFLERLRDSLQPGDVLLMRSERKLTSTILPGFWAHSALYLGEASDLPRFTKVPPGLAVHQEALAGAPYGCVIEAIAPRVTITRLEKTLRVDHVAVFRPQLPREEIDAIIAESLSHLGKPYDFEFDFNVPARLVCTELIYRCFHRHGGADFQLVKRVGRYTLSGDDIAQQFGHWQEASSADACPPFRLTSLILTGPEGTEWLEGNEAFATLRNLSEGWRPGDSADAASTLLPEVAHA